MIPSLLVDKRADDESKDNDVVDLHPSWLSLAKARFEEEKARSTENFGLRQLGEAIGYGKSSVGRLFQGQASLAVARAVARRYQLPPPMVAIAGQDEVDWLEAGRALARLAPDEFQKWLDHLRETVVLKTKEAELKQRVRPKTAIRRSDPPAKH